MERSVIFLISMTCIENLWIIRELFTLETEILTGTVRVTRQRGWWDLEHQERLVPDVGKHFRLTENRRRMELLGNHSCKVSDPSYIPSNTPVSTNSIRELLYTDRYPVCMR